MKLIEYIKENFDVMIKSKNGMRERIYDLEKNIKFAKQNEEFAINEMNKYKSKYLKLKRKMNKEMENQDGK